MEVGEEAQDVIDSALSKSDAFIFIHTEEASESDWIQKELKFAVTRNIPILWVQIDNANIEKLKIKPTEKPHLKYKSLEFNDKYSLINISEQILQKVFKLIMERTSKVFDLLNSLQNLFGDCFLRIDQTKMIYSINVERKGYHYPQRNINQYIQLFGRTPIEKDKINFTEIVIENKTEYDSAIILTDKIVKSEFDGKIGIDSYEDFFYHWNKYLNPQGKESNMEIVISGAFPDGDEICKQSLTDALIIFAKSILKNGYILTFGSHPTFQELFFEIAKEVFPQDHNKRLKMYISKWFEKNYENRKKYFEEKAEVKETEKSDTISASLTSMRIEMIQRNNVSALVCLGGKIKENKSEEGIREEIALAQEYGIPAFVVGSVGGCSSEVATEFKASKWEGLNNASSELNKEFMESINYFTLSQKMLDYLKENAKEVN